MVKVTPRTTVKSKDKTLDLKNPHSIAWWVQVTETPEETNKIVFKKGIPFGSKQLIPKGGQTLPRSILGDSAKWR